VSINPNMTLFLASWRTTLRTACPRGHALCSVHRLTSEPPVYQKFMLAELQSAVARLKLNVHKDLCPSSHLDALLASEKCDASAMQEKIAKCQVVTHKTIEVGKGIKDPVTTSPPGSWTTSTADEVAVELLVSGKVRHAQGQRLNRFEVKEREKSERTKGEGEMSTLFPLFLTPHF
jgi:hypothetical protein